MIMKALIIDDDDGSRRLMCDLLKLRNIECIAANSGSEALALLSPEIRFCVTDIMMPDLNGYEVAKRIKKKYPEMPIIASTASLSKVDKIKLAYIDLFDDVILKPVELENFNKIIDGFLGRNNVGTK